MCKLLKIRILGYDSHKNEQENLIIELNFNDGCFNDNKDPLCKKQEDGILDSKQVMEVLNIKDGTLRRLNKSGYLCPCRIGSRNFYSRKDIERILEKN